MGRRWLLFAAAIVGLTAACGGGDGTATPSNGAAISVTPAAAATATEAPEPAPQAVGTLEVRVTDQPAGGASTFMLTVRNIEVNVSGDEADGWRTVVEGPSKFDLSQLDGVEEVLGSATLEAGRYQQIRLEVVSALVTVRNGVRPATLPSDRLRLVGEFDVILGETTVLTLEFDAERSLTFIPMQGPQLKPVVKLLVRKGGQTLAEARAIASIGGDIDGGAVGPAPGSSPAPAPGPGSDGLQPVRVVIPTADNLQFMSFWIALGAGYFRDEGLAVQVVVPPNPTEVGDFLLQENADVAIMPPPMFLPMIAEEDPILVFGNLLQNDQVNLVIRPELLAERNLSTDTSVEERLRGISGLKVGVAPGPRTRLRVLFDSVGLDADSDIEIVIVPGPEQNAAYEAGLVDALYAHSPYLERALVRQGAVVLVNQSAGEAPELGGERQSHALVTTRAIAGDSREVLVKIIRAVQRGQVLAHTRLSATVQAVLDSGVPDLDRELVETIVEIYAPAIPESPVVSTAGVTRALELYPAHLARPDLSGLDLDAYVDTTIVQAAGS